MLIPFHTSLYKGLDVTLPTLYLDDDSESDSGATGQKRSQEKEAQALPTVGVLKRKSNGYMYLDVTNEYIRKTFPILILDGHLRPSDSFSAVEGAHITVVMQDENCPGIEQEVGKEFCFVVKELRRIEDWKTVYGGSRIFKGNRWIIAIESQELEELRLRYGLSPLIKQHDFHISIGYEVPFEKIRNTDD